MFSKRCLRLEYFQNILFFLVFIFRHVAAQQPEAATTNAKVAVQQPVAKSADLQQQPDPRAQPMFPGTAPGQSGSPQRSSNNPQDMNLAFNAERSSFNHNMARLGGSNGGNNPFPGSEPSRAPQRQSQSPSRVPTGADRAPSSSRVFSEGSHSRSPVSMNMEQRTRYSKIQLFCMN